MQFILWPLLVAGAAWLAWHVSVWVYRRTKIRPLAVLVFPLVALLPWIDLVPGYLKLKSWAKTHPPNAIYETHVVRGFFHHNAGLVVAGRILNEEKSYEYIEVHLGAMPSRYYRVFYADPADARCTRPPFPRYPGDVTRRATKCLAQVKVERPESRFAYSGFGGGQPLDDSVLFPLVGQHKRIYEIASGRTIAEAWGARYEPWIVRLGGPGPVMRSSRHVVRTFNYVDVLRPASISQ